MIGNTGRAVRLCRESLIHSANEGASFPLQIVSALAGINAYTRCVERWSGCKYQSTNSSTD